MFTGVTFKAHSPKKETSETSEQTPPAQTILWNAGDILKNFVRKSVDGKDTFEVKDPTKRGPTYKEIMDKIQGK